MFGDLVELILGEIVESDVEMGTRDIAAGLESRPLEKVVKPFQNFGVLSNGGESREVYGYMLECVFSKVLLNYYMRQPMARLRYPRW